LIKAIRRFWNDCFHSLRSGMLAVIIMSMILSVLAFVGMEIAANRLIENHYNSAEEKKQRYDEYMHDLQTYVSNNAVSSDDTKSITHWMELNPNVYLFIYKDGQLFFDGSSNNSGSTSPSDKEEDTDSGKDDQGADTGGDEDDRDGTGDGGEENSGGSAEDTSGEAPLSGISSESTSTSDRNPKPNASKPNPSGNSESAEKNTESSSSALTPAERQEIIAQAEKNGLTLLEFADGELFVTLYDFSDTVYYDLAVIVSIIGAVVIFVLILMLYFRIITTKISRLATDVSAVYEVDDSQSITTYIGNDELSELTRNVEQMRMSMLDSLKKEKEAIEANTELITSMSHDIRTPLTVLLGYLDIMKTHTDDETMCDYIKAAELTAMRMKELSDDMFRYFLVFAGKGGDVDMVEYNAATIFDQLFSEHLILLHEKGYEVVLNSGSELEDDMMISTDAPKLMRIVDNLISNMYKYADKEHPIELTATRVMDKLEIRLRNKVVKDKSRAESNGIGLKTCRKLCEALDIDFNCGIEPCGEDEFYFTNLKFKIVADSADAEDKK